MFWKNKVWKPIYDSFRWSSHILPQEGWKYKMVRLFNTSPRNVPFTIISASRSLFGSWSHILAFDTFHWTKHSGIFFYRSKLMKYFRIRIRVNTSSETQGQRVGTMRYFRAIFFVFHERSGLSLFWICWELCMISTCYSAYCPVTYVRQETGSNGTAGLREHAS